MSGSLSIVRYEKHPETALSKQSNTQTKSKSEDKRREGTSKETRVSWWKGAGVETARRSVVSISDCERLAALTDTRTRTLPLPGGRARVYRYIPAAARCPSPSPSRASTISRAAAETGTAVFVEERGIVILGRTAQKTGVLRELAGTQ